MPNCSSCGAEISWVVSATSGVAMPLDAAPCADGNIVVSGGKAHVLNRSLFAAEAPETPRYKSHFATCPNAAKHRRKR